MHSNFIYIQILTYLCCNLTRKELHMFSNIEFILPTASPKICVEHVIALYLDLDHVTDENNKISKKSSRTNY